MKNNIFLLYLTICYFL